MDSVLKVYKCQVNTPYTNLASFDIHPTVKNYFTTFSISFRQAGKEGHPLQYVTKPGESSGLRLLLDVQVYDYLDSTPATGLKVRVHDQLEPPLIEEFGFAAVPGNKALVSITKKKVST